MKTYKLLSLVILIFGLLHLLYPVFYPRPFGEELKIAVGKLN